MSFGAGSVIRAVQNTLLLWYNQFIDRDSVILFDREAPCVVVNVEYRLAPEHKYPADHDDAKCVVRWVAMNKSLVGKSVYRLAPVHKTIFH